VRSDGVLARLRREMSDGVLARLRREVSPELLCAAQAAADSSLAAS
jgi:hypothetical protein